MVKIEKEMENIKECMENIMRRSNIYLIRVPEGENGHNGAKAIFKEILAMNAPEVVKNMNQEIHDIQHIQGE